MIGKTLLHLFPDIDLMGDVTIGSDHGVESIMEWRYSEPQPTQATIEEIWEEIKDIEPTPPIQVRLRAILALQPAAVRAAFLPITAGVNYALEQGDTEAALAAITATEVPAKLEPAKAALIAEFEI